MNFKHEALAKQAWSGIQKSQKNLVATATLEQLSISSECIANHNNNARYKSLHQIFFFLEK